MEVTNFENGIAITQAKFTKEMFTNSEIIDFRRVSTPLPLNVKLSAYERKLLTDPSHYRSLVGKLNFLSNTRQDLSFSVQCFNQFMQSLKIPHMKSFFHTLNYVYHTCGQGLLITGSIQILLQDYTNLDWVDCVNTRRSVTRYMILLGNSPIS